MAGFRDCLTCRNIINLCIRIPLATFVIHQFSHWLFSQDRAVQILQIFTDNPSIQFAGRAASDLSTIQKMKRFWPPHKGLGYGEFSLAFTISLILFIRLIDISTVIHSIFGTRYKSRILNFVVTPIYTAVIPFTLLLPMMRLSEMYVLVIALNFVHILISSYIVYGIWYFQPSSGEALKIDKNEKIE